MTYHLARNGQQLGTCSREDAVARYARGEILPTDLVWCEGMSEWAAASTVFGAAPAVAATSTPTPPPMGAPAASTPVPPAAPVGAGTVGGAPKKPDNFLVWAILATVLCCVPTGIAAIIFSSQVDSKYARGDYAGAEQSAKNARMWTWISIGLGIVVGIVVAALNIAAIASGARY